MSAKVDAKLRLDRYIVCRVSASERLEIKQAAMEAKVTVSRFMRVAALSKARKRKSAGWTAPRVIECEI